MQVLQSLHGRAQADVFAELAPDTESVASALNRTVHLPITLLSKWLEGAAGSAVDLRSATLTPCQWASLHMCFAQAQLPQVRALHLSPSGPPRTFDGCSREFQEIQHGLLYHSMQAGSESRCCCCKTEGFSSPSKLSVGFECPVCRYQFCPTVYAPHYDIKSLLCKHSPLWSNEMVE